MPDTGVNSSLEQFQLGSKYNGDTLVKITN